MPVHPGFADAVLDSQHAFRAVLDAMAHPGRVVALRGPAAPAPLGPAAAAVCLTLLDLDTPVWLDAAAATADVVTFLRFHCGVPLVEAAAAARFALVADPARLPPLDAFDAGTDERPDLSATLVLQVDGLGEDGGQRLTGPGIEGEARLAVSDAPGLWELVRVNARRFPRGVDLILCAGGRLAALPRTTRVEGGRCTSR
jgi:alpha-D-ribose 1-methylphosphonate 5-triphosphate synthase subunit PhnH